MFFESLESRRLLSVSVVVAGETLVVQGTPDADDLSVTEDGGQVSVLVNGLPIEINNQTSFGPIDRILILGGAGDDMLSYSGNTVGAQIYGGAGNDQIFVNDIVVGSIVRGGNGDDQIFIWQASSNPAFPTIVFGNGGDDFLSNSSDLPVVFYQGPGEDPFGG